MGKTITFFNLRTRKKVRVPVNKTKTKRLKNGATARTARVGGVNLSRIVKGSKTGRRR
jgi:hypothetical protein